MTGTIVQDLFELKRNEVLSASTRLLTFALPDHVADQCLPGRFFNLRPLDSTAPLLRRPISICDVRREPSEMDFLVKTVGEGTRLLCERRPGARIDMVGPLGTAFEFDAARPAVMVAGGVGAAPLYFLARRMAESESGPPSVAFCYGARTEGDFTLLDRIEETATELILSTEDGSRGRTGFVTECVEDLLSPEAQVFVCGPSPMMNVVLKMLQSRGMSGQLSLENQMGCGLGACQGCVVPARRGRLRVCKDGPVVSSDALDFVFEG